eukprot:CAMPEP_0196749328 /NCGR_PEP_ID=MMETSP1091-20130531/76541_1 /TAXON_ID=302021 /ORGANISM="Rhodomonas sp., Strain CCMP768" /LENGTH=51 /DNA_ID=CAMNT_0042096795 /DNA_START=259 /DNA_END=414 /DNA_ORIENTATION=-
MSAGSFFCSSGSSDIAEEKSGAGILRPGLTSRVPEPPVVAGYGRGRPCVGL